MKDITSFKEKSPPVFLYRIGNFLFRHHFYISAKIITYINRILFSVWLPSSAQIGERFLLGYCGLGIVIHHRVKMGKNCLIGQNVTIGKNLQDHDVPLIGNDVYIGAGSVVFGEITIGDNVIIGANSPEIHFELLPEIVSPNGGN